MNYKFTVPILAIWFIIFTSVVVSRGLCCYPDYQKDQESSPKYKYFPKQLDVTFAFAMEVIPQADMC